MCKSQWPRLKCSKGFTSNSLLLSREQLWSCGGISCSLCSLSTLQNAHLIDNIPTLNDIEALRQGSVFAGSDVGHLIHYHSAERVFFDQGPGCRKSLLQVFVYADVDVVCKGPSIYNNAEEFLKYSTLYSRHNSIASRLQQINWNIIVNTSCVRLSKVNHKEISHITEVPDKLFKLVKLEEKRGSCAASETQNQWTVPCEEDCISNSVGCIALLSNSLMSLKWLLLILFFLSFTVLM